MASLAQLIKVQTKKFYQLKSMGNDRVYVWIPYLGLRSEAQGKEYWIVENVIGTPNFLAGEFTLPGC